MDSRWRGSRRDSLVLQDWSAICPLRAAYVFCCSRIRERSELRGLAGSPALALCLVQPASGDWDAPFRSALAMHGASCVVVIARTRWSCCLTPLIAHSACRCGSAAVVACLRSVMTISTVLGSRAILSELPQALLVCLPELRWVPVLSAVAFGSRRLVCFVVVAVVLRGGIRGFCFSLPFRA